MNAPESTPQNHSEKLIPPPERQPKRPHLFQKGQSGNPGGRPKEGRSMPKLLAAMRHVVTKIEGRDKTQLHSECRAWLHEDRKGFLSKFADLERSLAASQVKTVAAERIKELEDKNAVLEEQVKVLEVQARSGVMPGEPDAQEGREIERLERMMALWDKEREEGLHG